MEGVYSVNWADLLRPDSDIPHDVTFKIVNKDVSSDEKDDGDQNEKEENQPAKKMKMDFPADREIRSSSKVPSQPSIQFTQRSSLDKIETPNQDYPNYLPAHKLILASVSPVFKRQFYGSIPEDEVVDIKDSTGKAFKVMIYYIYQKTGEEGVEEIDDVQDLMDVFYLAEKYEVLGLKQKTLNRLSTFPVDNDTSSYEDLLSILLNYSYFEDACKVLQSRVFNLIKYHINPLDLVTGAINSKNDVIKKGVIIKLSSVGVESILETLKAVQDIIRSEGCKLDEKVHMNNMMMACVRRYEAVQRDPIKFSKFLPDPNSDLKEVFTLLNQYWKKNLCNNCDSAICKRGEKVKASEARVGSRVILYDHEDDILLKGTIIEVGLVVVPKHDIDGYELMYESICTMCAMMGEDLLNSTHCSGLHRKSDVMISCTDQCKIVLDSGEVIKDDYEDLLFDCDESNNKKS